MTGGEDDLTQYERDRLERIARNRAMLAGLKVSSDHQQSQTDKPELPPYHNTGTSADRGGIRGVCCASESCSAASRSPQKGL